MRPPPPAALPPPLPRTVLDHALVRRYDAEGGRHAHAHAQMLFGLDGALELQVQGRAAWVDASCGLLVPAGVDHAYRAAGGARVLVLDWADGPGLQRLRRFALPRGWTAGGVEPDRLLTLATGAPRLGERRRVDWAALARRIDADLARRWTLADLAALCCLSPQRLRARCDQDLQMAPLALVRARRLDRAVHLLQAGQSLDATAVQVGYGSASALSAALRRERGTGARQMRLAPAARLGPARVGDGDVR